MTETDGPGPDAALEQTGTLLALLDRALEQQQPLVRANVDRLRRQRPGSTDNELCQALERRFIAALTGSGAAVGAAATAPGVGTAAAVVLSAGEAVTSLELTVLFVLSVADIRGIEVAEVERRRTLILTVVVGEVGPRTVTRVTGRIGKHWAASAINAIPMSQIARINRVLGPRFVTKYGTKQGALVLGRTVPFGIGAGLGAAGNAAVAWSIVRGARRAFEPAAASGSSEPPADAAPGPA